MYVCPPAGICIFVSSGGIMFFVLAWSGESCLYFLVRIMFLVRLGEFVILFLPGWDYVFCRENHVCISWSGL